MEFTDKSSKGNEKCMVCLNPAWIKISVIENKEKVEKFVCVPHFLQFLDQYLADELENSILLFHKDSKILEIPLYEAMEKIGGLDEKALLEKYIKYMDDKIQNINTELSQSEDQFYANLLKSELHDKTLRKCLAQARIKFQEL